MKLFAIAAFAALGMASASCPNMCSGHGNCRNDDMCECYRNWMAADCSERVCPYDWSFVTTPKGDLNMDGDVYDAMQYSDSQFANARQITATAANANLLTIQMPGGDWEMWPGYGNIRSSAVTDAAVDSDEAHFYMECSNRGLCDRKTGQCECFDGYEGSACRRTVCATGCSGHGTCESVKALSSSYRLWDADKSMSCKCDPGYGGADCSERQCPKGDDPLTTKRGAGKGACPGTGDTDWGYEQDNEQVVIAVDGNSGAPSGYFQLQYADDFGETWWTGLIAADASEADLENAFKAIPNGVFEGADAPVSTSGNVRTWQVNFTHNSGNLNAITCLTVDRFSDTETAILANSGTCTVSVQSAYTNCATATVDSGDIASCSGYTDWHYAMGKSGCENGGGTYSAGTNSGKIFIPTATHGSCDAASFTAGDRITFNDGYTYTVKTATGASGADTTVTTHEALQGTKTLANIYKTTDGTTESAECSNRGLCDYETGTCACFQGYTGDDCATQSTLAW